MPQVLVIDDEEVLARTVCNYLEKHGISAQYETNAPAGLRAFERDRPAMTLLDYRLGRDDGLATLNRLRQIDGEAQVVMMTGHGDISVAVKAMKAGARDFLTKPTPLSTIAALAAEISPRGNQPQQKGDIAPLIHGRSAAIAELRRGLAGILQSVAAIRENPPSVLIIGETGTGKELIAQTLYQQGSMTDGPFVSINCAALPSHLVEAELFGHERGAFTDAKISKQGLFEAANGGLLFLDEVGELPPQIQAKLLRVLEERKVRRLGSVTEVPINLWVISATSRHLSDLVRERRFRSDLMFRLQVLWLESPALRHRDSDILLLAKHFLDEASHRYGRPTPTLSAEANAALIAHNWPGNVRELRNVIERAVIASRGRVLNANDIIFGGHVGTDSPRVQAEAPGHLRDLETVAIANALAKTGRNVSRAARLLGISRDTLRYRIQKYGLTE